MSKHTAGPWWVSTSNGERIWAHDGSILVAETQLSNMNTMFERKANARLIASAPELLKALEELLESTEIPPDRNCSCHISPPCGDCVDYSYLRHSIEKAKAAIAKARGEV